MSLSITESADEKIENDLVERAELLFEHQKEQYEASVDGYRRLEDKLMRLFGALSVIITTAILIIRYWWRDIFPGAYEPAHALCWFFLSIFLILCLVAWGFTFSGMQPRTVERPDSSNELVKVFMSNSKRQIFVQYSKEYSRLTDVIDALHAQKVSVMNKCSEAMLWSAWAFVAFLLSFIIIKISFKDDEWLKNKETNQAQTSLRPQIQSQEERGVEANKMKSNLQSTIPELVFLQVKK